ncbi:MAG: sensor histidine kinase [Bacteroidia bacterium]
MKLTTQTNLWYLFVTALIIFLGTGVFFFILKDLLDEEATETLYKEKDDILRFISREKCLPQKTLFVGDDVSFVETNFPVLETIKDTLVSNVYEDQELSPFRRLQFPVDIQGKHYRVTLMRSLFEANELVQALLYAAFSLSIITILILFITNRWIFRRIWSPFYQTLKALGRFQSNQPEPLNLNSSNTHEFQKLNKSLVTLTENVRRDFQNMKAFSENAAHELQTPLSIIQNSTETLFQNENLNEEQALHLNNIINATHRLSRLNKSLLMLSRIENKQFQEASAVDISALLKQKLEYYHALAKEHQHVFEINIQKSVVINIHPDLAAMLFQNLIDNAIKHASPEGKICLTLTEQHFEIRNPGNPLKSGVDKLYYRFYKESERSDSTGLGLAIVHSIIQATGLKLQYQYESGEHVFQVFFH